MLNENRFLGIFRGHNTRTSTLVQKLAFLFVCTGKQRKLGKVI